MLICTTWKGRPLSSADAERMMAIWGKLEAEAETNTAADRMCWYISADGTSGFTVVKVNDPDAAAASGLETTLALSEFFEFESRIVLDLESAMPAIMKGLERAKG